MRIASFLMGIASASTVDQPPPALELQDAELEALQEGQVVTRQELARGGSAGLAMMLVDATPDHVWDVILDVDRYVEFLPYVTSSWLVSDDPAALKWGMELTTKGVVTRFNASGVLHRDEGYLAWEMRPVGSSPLRASRGWWRVETVDSRTLLVYQADVQTAWWIPTRTHQKAASRGLPTLVSLMAARAAR